MRAPIGELCSENGHFVVDNIERCEYAAEELSIVFAHSENSAAFPKGCYQYIEDRSVYFNPHKIGSANSKASQICPI